MCPSRQAALLLLLLALAQQGLPASNGPEHAILRTELNGEPAGDLFVIIAPGGDDVYLEASDFAALGLETSGMIEDIDGMPLVSLASLRPGLDFELDERLLQLRITARPELLGVNEIGGYIRPRDTEWSEGGSAFVNYDLDYYRPPGASSAEALLTHEIGFRSGRVLALGSFSWQRTEEASDYRRLKTEIIVDDPSTMRRLTVLDGLGVSGPFGSALPIGGVTLAKNYSIDPYFVWFPTPQLAGSLLTASDVEIYQNGFLTRRLHLPPGQFEINDLQVAAIGAGSYDVVIRDAFGRERALSQPFYLSKDLLRRGLHAYNYGIGFVRDYSFTGDSSDPGYGQAAFLADHRYGLLERFTAGYSLELSEAVKMAAVSADVGLGRAGVLRLGTAMGGNDSMRGGAALLGYSYFGHRFSTNLHMRRFSDSFINLSRVEQAAPVELDGMLRLSIRTLRYSSLSAAWSRTDTTDGVSYSRTGLTWNQRLTRRAHLSATCERRVRRLGDGSELRDNRIFAGLHIFLPSRISLDVSQASDGQSSRQIVSASRNLPMQRGYGYRLSLERAAFDGLEDELHPDLQFMINGPFGTYSAEYDELAGEPNWRLGMAGSVALVEGSLFASRPLSQSFAVVRTSGLEGVRVDFNGLTVGRTRKGGELLVPNLRSYDINRISIAEEDLPLDYRVAKLERKVVPAPRSGAVVDFGLTQIRAVVGRLVTLGENVETTPLEHLRLSIAGLRADLSWRTGIDGEFYLEDIPAGRHVMSAGSGGRRFHCLLFVPSEDEAIIDLGEVLCEPVQ